jgi:DNA-binding beta-propeller fold protein YncE
MTIELAPRYSLVTGWEQLPDGWSHPDVAGVAVDSQDRVYLFCRAEHPLLVYDRVGRFVTDWDHQKHLFKRAHGITIGPDDSVYLTDDLDHTVRKFTRDGQLLFTLGVSGQASDTGYTGTLESIVRGGPPFNRPTNLSIATTGDLYITDGYGNARVHQFDADGRLVRSWGGPGSAAGHFNLPHGVLVLGDGRVLVADRENDRIQVFSLEGDVLDEWDDVQRPTAICSDGRGHLFVSCLPWWVPSTSPPATYRRLGPINQEKPGHVAVLDEQSGRTLARWGADIAPDAPGGFAAAHGVAIDSRGYVYVAEVTKTFAIGNGKVGPDCHTFQVFAPAEWNSPS